MTLYPLTIVITAVCSVVITAVCSSIVITAVCSVVITAVCHARTYMPLGEDPASIYII